VNTKESAIIETLREFRRFRSDVIALIDGDGGGNEKRKAIATMDETTRPKAVIQFGPEGEIEDLVAWIMEPVLESPGPILVSLLTDVPKPWTLQILGQKIKEKQHKTNWELHENLAWEAYNYPACRARVVGFLNDTARICSGSAPQIDGWQTSTVPKTDIPLYIANFIRNSV
jgi:hypothetical protein